MSVSFPHLARCYRTLLWLYPSELRRAYGRDMADVFERALDAEWRRRGRWGVVGMGLRAASEVFTVAIPGHLMNEWLIAGGLSLVINSGILALLVGIMTSPPEYFHH
ncbi:MAG TPA: hypothetical protein VFT60_10910 [Bryobacteraceae bacterium]|jgi:hypothetical protein|nr:hypothetical protein [Bryobacteraceae bacterium]